MSKSRSAGQQLITIVNKSVIPADAPDKILVVPWGNVESKRGAFVVDQSAAADILSAFERHGVLLPIDLEHQTLGGEFSSPDGAAPAVGWITALDVEVGRGIVASVEWTEQGTKLVQSKAYRYLSPTLSMIRATGRPAELHSVALTNKPAIVRMEKIANKDGSVSHRSKFGFFEDARFFLGLDESVDEEKIMDELEVYLSKLRDLVQVADGATQTEVMAALSARFKKGDDLRLAVCKALDVKPDDAAGSWEGIGEKLAAFKAHSDKSDGGQSEKLAVVSESLDRAHAQIKSLNDGITDRDAGERIKTAMSEGKLRESDVDPESRRGRYFLSLARDKESWESYMDNAPIVKPPKGSVLSSNSQSAPAARSGQGDVILANSERYNPDRMSEYGRIKAYQKEHKVSYEQAMEACGV